MLLDWFFQATNATAQHIMTYGPSAIEAVGIQGGWGMDKVTSLSNPPWLASCYRCFSRETDKNHYWNRALYIKMWNRALYIKMHQSSSSYVCTAHTYMKCSHLSARVEYQLCTQFIVLNYAPCNTVTSDGQLFTPNNPHPPAKIDQQAFIHTRAYWHMHPVQQ